MACVANTTGGLRTGMASLLGRLSLMNDAAGSGSQRGFAYTAWIGSAAGNYYSVGIGVELEEGWAVGMVASPCQY